MLWIIDSGHGGMINGIYQTAPKKMFKFPTGIIAYEGVINRMFKNMLIKRLKNKKIQYVDICPGEEDVSLGDRVNTISALCKERHNCILISLHSNAGKGTGFEIFTTKKKTKSDEYAEILAKILIKKFPYIKFRSDTTDGDLDKEEDFYIIKETETMCPGILVECLFFDNWNDYLMLYDPLFQAKYIQSLMDFIQEIEA